MPRKYTKRIKIDRMPSKPIDPVEQVLKHRTEKIADSLATLITSILIERPVVNIGSHKTGLENLLSGEQLREKLQSQNCNPDIMRAITKLQHKSLRMFFDSGYISERVGKILLGVNYPVMLNITTNSDNFWDVQSSGHIPIQVNMTGGFAERDQKNRLYMRPLNALSAIKTATAGGEIKFDLSVVELSSVDANELTAFIENLGEMELLKFSTDPQYTKMVIYCVDRNKIRTSHGHADYNLGDLNSNTLLITQANDKDDNAKLGIEMLRAAGICVIEADLQRVKNQQASITSCLKL